MKANVVHLAAEVLPALWLLAAVEERSEAARSEAPPSNVVCNDEMYLISFRDATLNTAALDLFKHDGSIRIFYRSHERALLEWCRVASATVPPMTLGAQFCVVVEGWPMTFLPRLLFAALYLDHSAITMTSSLRRTDILALSNLRNDGRRQEEIRRMRIQMGPLAIGATDIMGESVGGSALVEMGLTVALATVRGPIECIRRSDELVDRYVTNLIGSVQIT